jgi:hypothetical protein
MPPAAEAWTDDVGQRPLVEIAEAERFDARLRRQGGRTGGEGEKGLAGHKLRIVCALREDSSSTETAGGVVGRGSAGDYVAIGCRYSRRERLVVQFAVTLKNAEWTLFKNAVPLKSGMSRSEAVQQAEALAFEAEEQGDDVELVIQDYTGSLKQSRSGGGHGKIRNSDL